MQVGPSKSYKGLIVEKRVPYEPVLKRTLSKLSVIDPKRECDSRMVAKTLGWTGICPCRTASRFCKVLVCSATAQSNDWQSTLSPCQNKAYLMLLALGCKTVAEQERKHSLDSQTWACLHRPCEIYSFCLLSVYLWILFLLLPVPVSRARTCKMQHSSVILSLDLLNLLWLPSQRCRSAWGDADKGKPYLLQFLEFSHD